MSILELLSGLLFCIIFVQLPSLLVLSNLQFQLKLYGSILIPHILPVVPPVTEIPGRRFASNMSVCWPFY